MKKWIIGSLILIAVLTIYWAFNYEKFQLQKKGAYQYVIEGDKDNIVQKFYLVKKLKGEKEIDKLVVALLNKKNRDLLSKKIAIGYVSTIRAKKFLPYIKLVQKDFESMGLDSAWQVEIAPSIFRRSEIARDSYITTSLNEIIVDLSK